MVAGYGARLEVHGSLGRGPRSMNRRHDPSGFVAIELVLAIGLLLFPVVLLVASLPQWSERQHAAIVAAREAARVAAQEWPADGGVDAERVAREVATTYGIAPGDLVTVTVSPPPGRRLVDRHGDGAYARARGAVARARRRVVVDGT